MEKSCFFDVNKFTSNGIRCVKGQKIDLRNFFAAGFFVHTFLGSKPENCYVVLFNLDSHNPGSPVLLFQDL